MKTVFQRLTSAVTCEAREDSLVMVLPAELLNWAKITGYVQGTEL
ncbi:MAG: hypothetical protein ACLR0U_19015 [Enterocloster clostridioformis]